MKTSNPLTDSSGLNYNPFGMLLVGRNWESGTGYKYGFNGQEQDDEVYGNGNLNTAEFWEYDTRLGKRWNSDPIHVPFEGGYNVNRNNPILYDDPLGDCPDCKEGKYTIQKGDNYWNLEGKWNMDHGTLGEMNKGVDPAKLQIGQEIRVTINQSDLAGGITLNSDKSMFGMDNFFVKGAEGVNNIQDFTDEEFNLLTSEKLWDYEIYLNLMRFAPEKAMIRANSTGGVLDMKMYMLNNQTQYSTDNTLWFKTQNSISEPATRTLYIYKGYAYNLNEFGNLLFGAAHAQRGTSLVALKSFGNIFSLIKNGHKDESNEVKALERGYEYGKN